ASRDARFAHSGAVARHFQTLLEIVHGGEGPFDGAAQEAYYNRDYPGRWIDAGTSGAAANAAVAVGSRPAANAAAAVVAQTRWRQVGPSGVPADALVASESTGASAGTVFSGRATAIAVS